MAAPAPTTPPAPAPTGTGCPIVSISDPHHLQRTKCCSCQRVTIQPVPLYAYGAQLLTECPRCQHHFCFDEVREACGNLEWLGLDLRRSGIQAGGRAIITTPTAPICRMERFQKMWVCWACGKMNVYWPGGSRMCSGPRGCGYELDGACVRQWRKAKPTV